MISIVIPTFNEAESIMSTVGAIRHSAKTDGIEIIIADGGSVDATRSLAEGAGVIVHCCKSRGRAAQLNEGASVASGKILYFLHADSLPPAGFDQSIIHAVSKGYSAGSFRLQFDLDHWFLRANAFFTRFNVNLVRFGDQSLFVTKPVFNVCGKYSERHLLMEDQEIIHRIRRFGKFIVFPHSVITSARKYRMVGVYKLQAIFYLVWSLYYLGVDQERLVKLYKRLIK